MTDGYRTHGYPVRVIRHEQFCSANCQLGYRIIMPITKFEMLFDKKTQPNLISTLPFLSDTNIAKCLFRDDKDQDLHWITLLTQHFSNSHFSKTVRDIDFCLQTMMFKDTRSVTFTPNI